MQIERGTADNRILRVVIEFLCSGLYARHYAKQTEFSHILRFQYRISMWKIIGTKCQIRGPKHSKIFNPKILLIY